MAVEPLGKVVGQPELAAHGALLHRHVAYDGDTAVPLGEACPAHEPALVCSARAEDCLVVRHRYTIGEETLG